MGKFICYVCGFPDLDKPPWKEDGITPSYEVCVCCGVEFGIDDINEAALNDYERSWFTGTGEWLINEGKPEDWSKEEQLKNILKVNDNTLPAFLKEQNRPNAGRPKVIKYFNTLEDTALEITDHVRKKKYNQQLFDEYARQLLVFSKLIENEINILKEVSNRIYFTHMQVLIESNYSTSNQIGLIRAFKEMNPIILSIFGFESRNKEGAISEYSNSLLEEIQKNGTIDVSSDILLNYLEKLKELSVWFDDKDGIPRSTAGILINTCTTILSYTKYYSAPEPNALIRVHKYDIKEPLVQCFWKVEELTRKVICK